MKLAELAKATRGSGALGRYRLWRSPGDLADTCLETGCYQVAEGWVAKGAWGFEV